MIIRKRPIISWLLNIDNMEDEGKFGVPMLSNKQHFWIFGQWPEIPVRCPPDTTGLGLARTSHAFF